MVVDTVLLEQVQVQLVVWLVRAKCSKVCRAFEEPLALEVQQACKVAELTGTAMTEQMLAVNFGLGFQKTVAMTDPRWTTDSKSSFDLTKMCCSLTGKVRQAE